MYAAINKLLRLADFANLVSDSKFYIIIIITTQKKGTMKMVNQKIAISTALIFTLMLAVAIPVLAQTTYNPGVSTGQWIEYGNFAAPDNQVNQLKVQVVSVNGKEVTLQEHWEYKNGTVEDKNRIFNVETGVIDGQSLPPRDLLIPANLKDGDTVPPTSFGVKVGSAEMRTYLGVSRLVNIIQSFSSGEGYTLDETFVYDRVSGIRLESMTNYTLGTTSTIYSHSIVETNIFGDSEPTSTPTQTTGTATPSIPTEYIYVAVIVAVIVIVAVVLALKKRSK